MDMKPGKWLKNLFGYHASDFGKGDNWELERLKKWRDQKNALFGETALKTPANSLRSYFNLIKPYWKSEEKWNAWKKTAAVAGMTLLMVGLDLTLANTIGNFWGGIQHYDSGIIMHELKMFTGLAFTYVFLKGQNQKTSQRLQMDCRKWFTRQFTDAVFDKKTLPRLKIDNIDQRIAEDLNLAPEKAIKLLLAGAALKGGMGGLEAAATFVGFIGMLWNLSPTAAVSIMDTTVNVPYLVPAVLAWSTIGIMTSHKIGNVLKHINFERQKLEGDYRNAWAHVREYTNEIGLSEGEAAEKNILEKKFDPIEGNWNRLVNKEKHVTWFSQAFGQAAAIFPVVVSLPAYMAKEIVDEIGGLQKILRSFSAVQNALSFPIDAMSEIMSCVTCFNRVTGVQRDIARAHKEFDDKNEPHPPTPPEVLTP